MSLFLRLLGDEDKGAALEAAIRSVAAGKGDARVFTVDAESFEQVPGAPFAYWVSIRIRSLFQSHAAAESETRRFTKGLCTTDDFRYLRCFWEIPAGLLGESWHTFANGGASMKFYQALSMVINWGDSGDELKAFLDNKIGKANQWSRWINSVNYYFRPGLTWPLRTSSFSPQVLPAGSIFSVRSYAGFMPIGDLRNALGLMASAAFDFLLKVSLGRFGHPEFVIGVVQQTPFAEGASSRASELGNLAHRAWILKRNLDKATLSSRVFAVPALLHVAGASLESRAAAWTLQVKQIDETLAHIQSEIDSCCFDLYAFDASDRAAALGSMSSAADAHADTAADPDDDEDNSPAARADPQTLGAELFDWLVGVAFGRFDVRLATGECSPPDDPEPFDPLPVCPPGMLRGDDGLPLSAEHGRRLRTEGRYPLDIAWDGILVDDPEHPLDIEQRVQDVLVLIWGDRTDALQQETCELLGVPTLRDWFRRPAGFFADHLKRYSKSRRQAPIYWPLSTPGGRYTLWLFYHRFSRDTLYRALEQVKEKVNYEERRLQRLTADAGSSPGAAERAALADQESFVTELRTFHEELARVAPLWNPDLNDGVILNDGPLWRMIGHTPWQKAVKARWDEMVAGKTDWAHLAMHLWPERVVPKCATDRSLAIAHGLESVFWEEGEGGKWRARVQVGAGVQGAGFGVKEVIADLVRERTSAAVKDALNSLLEAPAPVSGRAGGRKSSGRTSVSKRAQGSG